jgi:hypothetical protein
MKNLFFVLALALSAWGQSTPPHGPQGPQPGPTPAPWPHQKVQINHEIHLTY